jgi:hypothetical protein
MKHIANYNLQTQADLTKSDGLVVRFGRSYQSLGVEKGEYGRVTGINEEKGVVQLQMQDGRTIEWDPERAVKVEVFESREKGLAVGDVVRWTRNCHELGLRNGETAKILDVRADGSAKVELTNGETKELNLNGAHWDHGYAGTIFSAQGRTSESVIAIMPSNSPLSDQRSAYVAISRAKSEAYIYTDSKKELQSALEQRTGEPSTALEHFSPFRSDLTHMEQVEQQESQTAEIAEIKLPHEENQMQLDQTESLEPDKPMPMDVEQVEQQAIEAEQSVDVETGIETDEMTQEREEMDEISEEISSDLEQEQEQEMGIGM